MVLFHKIAKSIYSNIEKKAYRADWVEGYFGTEHFSASTIACAVAFNKRPRQNLS